MRVKVFKFRGDNDDTITSEINEWLEEMEKRREDKMKFRVIHTGQSSCSGISESIVFYTIYYDIGNFIG
jgi:hypothetical protein